MKGVPVVMMRIYPLSSFMFTANCADISTIAEFSPEKKAEWYYRYILILWGSGSMPLPLPSPKLKSNNIISFSINYYHLYVRTVIPIHINLHVQDYPKLSKLHILCINTKNIPTRSFYSW